MKIETYKYKGYNEDVKHYINDTDHTIIMHIIHKRKNEKHKIKPGERVVTSMPVKILRQ